MSIYNKPWGALLGKDGNVERKHWKAKVLNAIQSLYEALSDDDDEPPSPKPAPVLTLIICNPERVEEGD
jgi:hypothetical protein